MAGGVIIVAGPTASGKSGLALELAQAFDGVVINADSMQVYGELRVLTARPDADAEKRAPHRLYGILRASDVCSAARWRDLALNEIEAARAAGKVAIVAGGTGLYLRTLLQGIAPVPDIPEAVRESVRALHRRLGPERFHAALAERDPVMAKRLSPGDTQRVIRAREVLEASGTSLAEWQQRTDGTAALAHPAATIVLEPPRAELYARCNARFIGMVRQGALDEVRALLDLKLDPGLPAMKALGVPELAQHLTGELSLDAAVSLAQQSTRRYAKRQTTWFRHQISTGSVLRTQFSSSFHREIFAFIRQFLLTVPG
ncbi:MAG TPA: tRNA (adenosine(37)-N6)-dimethylallyltransferase MiaA [Stellaceae bacterium]|nr:tRNA (adenosine(37)-N6)-dimethylallyltransferase MiaA [Stellaceae bacterium]